MSTNIIADAWNNEYKKVILQGFPNLPSSLESLLYKTYISGAFTMYKEMSAATVLSDDDARKKIQEIANEIFRLAMNT